MQPPVASPPVVRVRSENSLLQSPPPVVSDIPSQQDIDVEAGQEVAQSSAVGADDTSTGQSVGQDTGLAAGWIDDPIDQAEARRQFNRAMRDSESLSEELKEEVIQLLQAMNLPYLVAPFEAEAQCAVLEQVLFSLLKLCSVGHCDRAGVVVVPALTAAGSGGRRGHRGQRRAAFRGCHRLQEHL